MAQQGLRDLTRNKVLQDRGALPKEEGNVIGEHKAMHEENFLSSWLKSKEGGRKEEIRRGRKKRTEWWL